MDKEHKNTNTEKLNKVEEKASPYRAPKTEYEERKRHGDGKNSYGARPVKPKPEKKQTKIIRLFPAVTESDKHRKIERTQKDKRKKKQQIQAILGITIALMIAIVLFFMTPLFQIKEIRLNGNDTVSKEIINTKVGDLIGANLFSTSISDIEERMMQIPQISEVKVKKAIFPSRLEIVITESKPVAYIRSGNVTLVIDSDLRIVDDASVFDYEKLPSISGVSVSNYQLNETLDIKSQEKKEVLTEMLQTFETTGLVGEVRYISIDDLTAITFNYDNRIDVSCGSQLQMERKIRMFAECIATSTFDENSIGTMDLSVPGTATYNP